MPFFWNFPFLCIFLAMVSAILLSVLPGARRAYWITVGVSALCCLGSLVFLFWITKADAAWAFPMGKFPAPFGNEIKIGPLQGLLTAAALASLLLTAFLNRRAALAAGAAVEAYYGYLTPSAALGACFVFALCRRLAPQAEKHAAPLQTLAGCTLGVYLLHPVFIDLLRGRVDFAAHSAVWLFPASYLAVVLIPLGLTLLLQRLPPLNKLVT